MKQSIKPSYTLHKNFRLPMGFSPENFDSGFTYQAQARDTFIVTYPKCGTTWTQHIVWMLSHDGKPLPLDKNINFNISVNYILLQNCKYICANPIKN